MGTIRVSGEKMKREITLNDFERLYKTKVVRDPALVGKRIRLVLCEVRREGPSNYTLYLINNRIYFIKSWEVYLKLFGHREGEGMLLSYAKKHRGKFKGAKISIKRLRERPTFTKLADNKDIDKPYFEIKLLKNKLKAKK